MASGEAKSTRKRKRTSSEKQLDGHELKRTKNGDKAQHKTKENAAKTDTHMPSVSLSKSRKPIEVSRPNEDKKHRGKQADKSGKRKSKKSRSKSKLKDSSLLIKASSIVASDVEKKVTAQSLKKVSKIRKSTGWFLSTSSGGRFLNSGPLFSEDEKYLLLASQRTLNVYSVETSLLVRAIAIPKQSRIRAYALSRVNPSHAFVTTSRKQLIQFDWVSGKEIASFELDQEITEIQTTAAGKDSQDVLYAIGSLSDGDKDSTTFVVSKITQRSESLANKPDVHQLWKSTQPVHLLRVVGHGEQVLFASDDKVMIGLAEKGYSSYLWHEIQTSDPVSSLDVQLESLPVSGKKKAQGSRSATVRLNVAIGGVRGAIFVYMIGLDDLKRTEGLFKKDGQAILKPRILHWHREAVEAIRFSHDGNYILSGGHESVFILWQLETGKRQELPHLPSPIIGITISPTGTSYGLQLTDNSAIVISTSELQAIAHVAGIQSRIFTYANPAAPKLKTVTSKAEASNGIFGPWTENPAVVNPRDPSQILVAVPSVQTNTGATSTSSSPYIQTFDTSSSRHVSRQPLARNNVTVKAIGPDANKLIEPNIRFMQISEDGQWLATIDEWLPPPSDINAFADGSEDVESSRRDRLESYLKLWLWNEDQGHWMLETRIDMPHRSDNNLTNTSVLDLVSDPSGLGFATIGEDGFVRIWRPKTRYEDGTVKHGAYTEGSISWSCRHAIELEGAAVPKYDDDNFNPKSPPMNAKLAYSHDGSILAAAQERSSAASLGVINLIDATNGSIHSSLTSMYRSNLAGLGFCDQFLIVLSNDLVVWDVTTNRLTYGFPLDVPSLPGTNSANFSKLAVNATGTAFAIAVPAQGKWLRPTNLKSHVLVFEPRSPMPTFTNKMPDFVLSLMPVPKSPSFMVLNSVAEIRTIAPRSGVALSLQTVGKTQSMALAKSENTTALDRQARDIEEDATGGAKQVSRLAEDEDMDADDDAPIVRKEQLEDALDLGPAFALPPPRKIFDIVAQLFAGKPRK